MCCLVGSASARSDLPCVPFQPAEEMASALGELAHSVKPLLLALQQQQKEQKEKEADGKAAVLALSPFSCRCTL